MKRSVKVTGPADKIKSLTSDYGDGKGEHALSTVNPALNHTFKDNGEYTVTVKVVDVDGDIYKDSILATVLNVSPSVDLTGMNRLYYERLEYRGSFTDPGFDSWTVTVDYGDGSGEQTLSINDDKTFYLNHQYTVMGRHTVTVKVRDDDGGEGSASSEVYIAIRSGGGGSSSNANLSDLDFDPYDDLFPLYQNEPPIFTGEGFLPYCQNYRVSGFITHITPVIARLPTRGPPSKRFKGMASVFSNVLAAAISNMNGYQYRVILSNNLGSVTSEAATLTVNAAPTAPAVTTHPSNQTITEGQTASFSA